MKEIIKECIDLEKKLEQRELELNEIMIERNNLLDRIDKAIETIEQLKKGSYIEYTDTTALAYHTPQPCCIARLDVIEKKLRGKDNE